MTTHPTPAAPDNATPATMRDELLRLAKAWVRAVSAVSNPDSKPEATAFRTYVDTIFATPDAGKTGDVETNAERKDANAAPGATDQEPSRIVRVGEPAAQQDDRLSVTEIVGTVADALKEPRNG